MVITKVVERAPAVLKSALSVAPQPLVCTAIERLFRQIFRNDCQTGQFDFLEARWAAIEIRDLALQFQVGAVRQPQGLRLVVQPPQATADVKMRVTAAALLQLATQRVDPDTLFFRRQLLLTGDTELGLQIKNLLDTIDVKERLPGFLFTRLDQLAENSLTWIN